MSGSEEDSHKKSAKSESSGSEEEKSHDVKVDKEEIVVEKPKRLSKSRS